jgi:glycosyltransferase involved in cell wall biosynthesis
MNVRRVAYLVTHPIQYQAPLLRRIAAEKDIYIKVFFASDISVHNFIDPGFKGSIRWDVPLLDGYEYEFLPSVGPKDRISFWWPLNRGLAERLKAGRFDALWVHGYARWQHWAAMLTAKRLGIRVLLRDEATALSTTRGPLKRAVKRWFFPGLGKIVDGFLAIGTMNRHYYREHEVASDRIFMTPYAVDNAFFQARAAESASKREQLRAALGLEPGRPVILYAGKMTSRKRPDDLLDAYIRLSQDGRLEPCAYLLYVGDGELRRGIEARACETGWRTIKCLGFKNQTEMPAFYDLCDLLVIPSLIEPWGLVVNEAMNAGKAVITSDNVGCAPDLVRHGENGLVYKTGDSADLSEALRDTLADAQRCREMGQRSLNIINRWSFEEDVQGLRAALSV